MALSERLAAIVRMVPPVHMAADIGCDHGQAAMALLESGRAQRVICGDISAPSLEKARRLAQCKGLLPRTMLRVGSGFSVLEPGEAQAAVVAGMGGELIAQLLAADAERLPPVLVLSCNTAQDVLRAWLCVNGYAFADEALVCDKRHYYPVMRVQKGPCRALTARELEFGPVLLEKKPDALREYVRLRIRRTRAIRSEVERESADAALLAAITKKLQGYTEVERWLSQQTNS